MKITGADVAARRKSLKLSREAFAAKCGLTASKIWRIETKGEFKGDELTKITGQFFSDQLEAPSVIQPAGWCAPSDVITETFPAIDVDELADVTTTKGGIKFNFDQFADQIKKVGDELSQVFTHALALAEPPAPEPIVFDKENFRYISHSEIATFRDCRRRWWLSWHRGLRPITENVYGALAMGTRVHKALEMYYSPTQPFSYDPRETLEKLILQDNHILQKSYAVKGEVVPPEIKKKFDTEAKMQRVMIEGYLEWVASEGTDSNYETVSPERYIETDAVGTWFDERGTKLVGRIDRVLRRIHDGALLFEDFKTAASIPTLVQGLPRNTQMKHYKLLLQWTNDEPIVGALYTILRKSMQTATATPPFYARVEVHHSPIEIKNYEGATMGEITRIREAEEDLSKKFAHQLVVPPRPSNDCSWKCPFAQICPMFDDGSHVESMLEEHFTTDEPLAYYQVGTKKETE